MPPGAAISRACSASRKAASPITQRPHCSRGSADDPHGDEPLFILRHTLMNPWLVVDTNGINFLDRYCDVLVRTLRTGLYR